MARFGTGFLLVAMGFLAGFTYRNYQWNEALGSIITIPEQSSVERALIYSEMYYEGKTSAAHEWMLEHALSDPEWNLDVEIEGNPLFQAMDFPSFQGLENVRLNQLEEIRVRQRDLRERVNADAL